MPSANTPVAPPDPRDLRAPDAERRLLEHGPFSTIPRPEIKTPSWTRLETDRNLNGLLVAFRTLLTHEAQFVSIHLEVPPSHSTSSPRTVDVVLPDVRRDDDGLLVIPDPSAANWADVAHNLAIGTWFAHVQHVAELLEVGLRELDRGRISTASALVRTAVEMAARLNVGLTDLHDEPKGSIAAESLYAQHLTWLISGDGRPARLSQPGSITKRIQRLTHTCCRSGR